MIDGVISMNKEKLSSYLTYEIELKRLRSRCTEAEERLSEAINRKPLKSEIFEAQI
jgi:hypothetical protein